MKEDTKNMAANGWGCSTEYRSWLAFELLKVMCAATGLTYTDSKAIPPKELVSRAFEAVDEYVRIAKERGWYEQNAVAQPEPQRKPQ